MFLASSKKSKINVAKAMYDSLNQIEEICGKLKQKVQERLLSEDLLTESILNYYFHTVKLLNIIDREMVYYNTIVNPIKRYLVKRPDVLKAIIGFGKSL